MNNTPLVSVLMPCYNAERFLEVAVNSITGQTYKNLEIICINDGSKDKTGEILERLALKDDRIKVVHNSINLKLIGTLNKGIDLAQGELIARMDADDISRPGRIGEQVKIFNKNPDIDVVSCAVEVINNNGKNLGRITDFDCTSHLACQFVSLFSPPVNHPAAMVRANVLKEFKYKEDPALVHVEDYDLWSRLILNNKKFYNIQEPLFLYRLNTQGVSISNRKSQNASHLPISKRLLKSILNVEVKDEYLSVIERLDHPTDDGQIQQSLKEFERIKNKYLEKFENTLTSRDIKEIKSWYKQRMIFMIFNSLKKGSFDVKFHSFFLFLKKPTILFSRTTYHNFLVRSKILLLRR